MDTNPGGTISARLVPGTKQSWCLCSMTHKERNHIYFEEQCCFLTMSRASSFLGVFPSLCLRLACRCGRGLGAQLAGAAACPGAVQLLEHWDILLELRVPLGSLGRAQVCPEQGWAQGCWEWDPQGTPTPPGHSSAHQVGTCRCPRLAGAVGRGVPARAGGCGQPRTQQRVLPRPNHLVADVASPTPTHIKAAQLFPGPRPFPSWVIWHSWSSFPTRQQHQLQLLISAGCNPGWNQVRGSCWCQWRSVWSRQTLCCSSCGAAGDLCCKGKVGPCQGHPVSQPVVSAHPLFSWVVLCDWEVLGLCFCFCLSHREQDGQWGHSSPGSYPICPALAVPGLRAVSVGPVAAPG